MHGSRLLAAGNSPPLIRFGAFEVHVRAHQLRKHGVKIKLHGQPFQILLMLLERPGEVITREEMREKLWPADTFVDFEHSLNTAIKKLRQALGDSAEEPRYIETLPRLGYRFIGEVAEAPAAEAAVETAGLRLATFSRTGARGQDATPSSALASFLSWFGYRPWRWILIAAAAAGLTAWAAISILHLRGRPPLSETDLVLVSDFVNETGDPVFDDTLKQAISVQLLQSPYLNILSDARVASTLRLMTKAPDTKLTPDVVRDICQRAGGKVYIAGSIKTLGSEYVIDLNAVNCQTGDLVAEEEATADRKERVLSALGDEARSLRKKLGESLTTIQTFDTPIEEATTPSLEALQALSVGRKAQQVEGNAAAIPFFERAVELDPNFAAAYAALGTSYSNLREPALASENLTKAYQLRGRVSQLEKLRISAYYYHLVTGELEKANEVYKLWAKVYPRDNVPRSNLGVTYGYLGQYDKAVAEILEALRLYPDSAIGYTNLVSHYAALNRLDDAKAIYQQALGRKLDNPYLHLNRYGVAFLEGDSAQMQQQITWAAGKPQAEDLLLSAHSDTEAYSGRLALARDYSRRASESARRNGQNETAAEWQMNAALRESEFGNAAKAREQTRSVLAAYSNRELQILGALALARSGDERRARQIAEDLESRFPLDTAINQYWLPTIRAAIELSEKNPTKALEILQSAASYELGNPLPQAEIGAFLYPAYLRGQAYLELHRGKEAAVEFQKFLDHRGITVNCPLGSLGDLGLARAYALTGEDEKSLAQYRQFLTLWKNADPDLRVLKEAKAEYAKLSQRAR